MREDQMPGLQFRSDVEHRIQVRMPGDLVLGLSGCSIQEGALVNEDLGRTPAARRFDWRVGCVNEFGVLHLVRDRGLTKRLLQGPNLRPREMPVLRLQLSNFPQQAEAHALRLPRLTGHMAIGLRPQN